MTPQNIQLACLLAALFALLVAHHIEKRKNRRLRTKGAVASHTIASLAGLIDLIKAKAPHLSADPDVKRMSAQALSVVSEHRARLVIPSPELDLLSKDLEALAGLEQRSPRRLYT